MTATAPFALTVLWVDGERETVSGYATLQAAARDAFELSDRLSLPDAPRTAVEVAVLCDSALQLSITIIPGEGLGPVSE